MAIMQRLRSLGITVVVPKDPVEGWKETLLQTGRFGEKKIDFLLEGEGTSVGADSRSDQLPRPGRAASDARAWPRD